ncbi:MAG: host attachment protein [Pseudomonadota bacterium]
MDVGGITWIVAADAVEARVFAERVRSGPVKELASMRMAATDAERGIEAGAGPHERHGSGRQGLGEHDDGDKALRRFLRRVSSSLSLAATRGEYDRLVLMGPPRTLGVLRDVLPQALAARVEATDAHERRRDTPDEVRQHLRDARARHPAAQA